MSSHQRNNNPSWPGSSTASSSSCSCSLSCRGSLRGRAAPMGTGSPSPYEGLPPRQASRSSVTRAVGRADPGDADPAGRHRAARWHRGGGPGRYLRFDAEAGAGRRWPAPSQDRHRQAVPAGPGSSLRHLLPNSTRTSPCCWASMSSANAADNAAVPPGNSLGAARCRGRRTSCQAECVPQGDTPIGDAMIAARKDLNEGGAGPHAHPRADRRREQSRRPAGPRG